MPGYIVCQSNTAQNSPLAKYLCSYCNLLLRNPVQLICGHWLCQSCADELLASRCLVESSSAKCPKVDCNEDLKEDEDGLRYFPDQFVRRKIEQMIVGCPHQTKGCQWEDKVIMLEVHLQTCNYLTEECKQCCQILTSDQIESHARVCPKAKLIQCPLVKFGCPYTRAMKSTELKQHAQDCIVKHLEVLSDTFKFLEHQLNTTEPLFRPTSIIEGLPSMFVVPEQEQSPRTNQTKPPEKKDDPIPGTGKLPDYRQLSESARVQVAREVDKDITTTLEEQKATAMALMVKIARDLGIELEFNATKQKEEEILALRNTVTKLEEVIQSKDAELEDRDFRLSLIENSNHDGSMIWRIPRFSQRMADAQTGRYISIFSPFYMGRYGYKMCLRLYILGDGIGKNTHMSLFFVVMKGELDDILQWPFTHRVTFKLINQTREKDICISFQPDPMSSSFHRPISDMNIASGCPRFASHTELKNNKGFIMNDTVFIECLIG